MLFCKLPHEGQATKWAPYLRERYFKMLEDCTHIDCISLRAQPDAQLLAYQRIIDQSDLILTVLTAGRPRQALPRKRLLPMRLSAASRCSTLIPTL